MPQAPDTTEWDTSSLSSERRAYLDANVSFEQIADDLISKASVGDARVEPYRTHPPNVPKETRQIIFRLVVSLETYDLFFNARDGLRGRYWQGGNIGDAATCCLIRRLTPKLLDFVNRTSPTVVPPAMEMTLRDIQESLDGRSAKVWVRENGTINAGGHVFVARWAFNESRAPCSTSTGALWRWEKLGTELEIKGALIRPDGSEEIPISKLDRADQIHRCGFT